MAEIYTVAILGVGARGGDVYGTIINDKKDKFRIVSLCDKKPERLERFGEKFGVGKDLCFTDENEFFKEKRADLLIIATLDTEHARHLLKALEKGYDVLCEKPLTGSREECDRLVAAQKKYGGKVLVCHVLRYAPAFMKVGELLDSGVIGRLVLIDALERVGHAHQAHSYVRGNWRNTKVAMPMILAKCCHDLDLLQYYVGAECETVSSIGDLAYFKPENAPEGAARRCVDCKYKDTCAYSAVINYIDRWKESGQPEDSWPYNVVANAPVTEEKLLKAMTEGPYGRCVFACDNDVVDHQITIMTFKNGVKASLTMTAFVDGGGRRMVFHGTTGEIIFDEAENLISVRKYGKSREDIPIDRLLEKGYGHGGGDAGLINTLYDILSGVADERTSLKASIESHLMGIAAEESRLNGGRVEKVHK